MLGGGAAIIKYPGLSACGVIPFWILDFGGILQIDTLLIQNSVRAGLPDIPVFIQKIHKNPPLQFKTI